MFIIFSVFYILIAAAMIVLILIQRGSGADAGSGFGGGGSATVFGARGSASFLSRATGALAGLFFLLSLGMAVHLSRSGAPRPLEDLGVMAGMSAVPAATSAAANAAVPATAPASDVPGAVPGATTQPTPPASQNDVPAAPQAGTGSGQSGAGQGVPQPTKD